ncbi:AAA family ATPase [Dactylosporangium sp. CA-233914]|uniref:helix-turn-helix transcriptional regulator n=1 Tax=Dactylosporangium sp. CA-233914 TaxID=3239934 RepID=UPI003D8CDE27
MPSAPFIGRAAQLAEIADAWASRRPGIILITGEGGSGKSRLVAEALSRLDLSGTIILRGAARAQGAAPHDWLASVLSGRPSGDLPVEESLLNRLAQRSGDGSEPRLAPATTLRAAVDVVRALLRATPPVAASEPDEGAFIRHFTRFRVRSDSAGSPLGIIVVEDLHDLDPASLALVAELAAAAESLPALLLVTSRPSQEAAFAPAAARTLRRLGGGPSVLRMHVAPFNARETAELIEATYGSAPAPEAVRGALHRTGGNAFWLAELLVAYDTADDLPAAPLPAHVVGLLVEPLSSEPALVGRVARAAALLGDPVESDVLFHVCGGDVEPALRRLLDLGLLLIAPDLAPAGSLRFRHPLLREALAAGVMPRERTRVHTLARRLAVELGDDAALARHAAALGRTAEARAAAARGAAASLATGLPDAAVELVALGLRLPANPAPPPNLTPRTAPTAQPDPPGDGELAHSPHANAHTTGEHTRLTQADAHAEPEPTHPAHANAHTTGEHTHPAHADMHTPGERAGLAQADLHAADLRVSAERGRSASAESQPAAGHGQSVEGRVRGDSAAGDLHRATDVASDPCLPPDATGDPRLRLRAAGGDGGSGEVRRALVAVGASAAFVSGRFAVAADHAADWLNEVQLAGDADAIADAHRQLAAVRWCLGDAAGHRRSLDRAAAVGGSAESLARQRAAEAESALRTEDAATALPLAEGALAAAERTGAGIGSASVTLGTALALTGEFERGVALLRAARQLAAREHDPVTIGRAVHNLVAVSLPRLGEVLGWRLFDEAMATIGRYGLEFCAGSTTTLGVAHALRTGDLARAESLVWSRLPIEGDPVERVRFTARAGLLALERGDDPLAVRMLARADAEGRDSGLVRVLRVAVAARGVHPVDPAEALRDCVGRCRPARLAEAARWALRGGVPAAVVAEHVPDQSPRLRLLLAVAAGRDTDAVTLLPAALAGENSLAGGNRTAGSKPDGGLAGGARLDTGGHLASDGRAGNRGGLVETGGHLAGGGRTGGGLVGTGGSLAGGGLLDTGSHLTSGGHTGNRSGLVETGGHLAGDGRAGSGGGIGFKRGGRHGRAGRNGTLSSDGVPGGDGSAGRAAGGAAAGRGDVDGRAEDAAVHTAVAHALVRLGRAGEARRHAERAVALLAHWPGWRLADAETLLHSLRAGGDLTARELEVLGCLAAGMTNQQVASSLGISVRTVTVHVSNLLRKTGATSRTEAALWAVRHRLAPER